MNHIHTHDTWPKSTWLAMAYTRTGRQHRQAGRPNEDAAQVRWHAAGGLTLALADGVGSGWRGDLASAAVVQHWVQASVAPDSTSALSAAQALLRGSEAALQCAVPPALGAAGSMAVVAWTWDDGQALIGHVGDCRAYLCRAGQAHVLTRDHTYANLGLRPPAWRLPEHPARMVGGGMMGPADMQRLQLQSGDLLVLCSDGVHGVLDDATFAATCAAWGQKGSQQAAEHGLRALAMRLVRLARLAGSKDDVSVVLASYNEVAQTTAPTEGETIGVAGGRCPPPPIARTPLPAGARSWCAESVWPEDWSGSSEPPAEADFGPSR